MGIQKKMGCKADGKDEYRSNLMVVMISSRHPTKQTAFSESTLTTEIHQKNRYISRGHSRNTRRLRYGLRSIAL